MFWSQLPLRIFWKIWTKIDGIWFFFLKILVTKNCWYLKPYLVHWVLQQQDVKHFWDPGLEQVILRSSLAKFVLLTGWMICCWSPVPRSPVTWPLINFVPFRQDHIITRLAINNLKKFNSKYLDTYTAYTMVWFIGTNININGCGCQIVCNLYYTIY